MSIEPEKIEAVEAAKKALRDSEIALAQVQSLISNETQIEIARARTAVLERHSDRLRLAEERRQTAKTRLDGARLLVAPERLWNGHKVGTILVEWVPNGPHYSRMPYKRSGRRGEVIVWDREAEGNAPANLRWNLPNLGDTVLRIIKRDGSPGKLFVTERGLGANDWLPWGTNHRTVK